VSSAKVPALSLVIPVHNEADNVAPLLAEIRAALNGRLAYEVIYVDDASTDDTAARLRALLAGNPQLRVLGHRERCGQSSALRTGVKAARAPWVVTLDGDGQNDPADIPRFLALLDRPDRPARLQLVIGYRRRRQDSAMRRLSSRLANAVRARLLHDRTPDVGCGLKLLSREAFLDLPFFDHMHRFLPALILRNGGQVVTVEVSHRPRSHGRSHYGVQNRLWVGIVDMLGVMWLRARAKCPVVVED
jgi:dolichol-phosphate mannosyltransferase